MDAGKAKRGKSPSRIRLGIDFGTTRTLVARIESGNYPLVAFETEWGEAEEWYPSLMAGKERERVFGWDAWSKIPDPAWQKIRSLKRLLSKAHPGISLTLGGAQVTILDLLTEYLGALRRDLLERSNLNLRAPVQFEAMIGVPANANNNQRFLTLEAFRRAGFHVLGMINEPMAAGIEYAYRFRQRATDRRLEYLLVYDLGGGTFDLSVIQMSELSHRVMTTAGIERLGGDDFDQILADLALAKAGLEPEAVSPFWLLEECRERKERLTPHTKKIHLDLSRAAGKEVEVTVRVEDFEREILPLVEETIRAVDSVLTQPSSAQGQPVEFQNAGLYVVGGAAELPLIPRLLRERYGRRVRKSPYPRAATAIGLAIAADELSGFSLEDRFTRHFGVWREAEEGERIVFDPIFSKDLLLPPPGAPPLVRSRRYHPAHNIGHFRYLECSQLDPEGQPTGEITTWDEVRFPFDPSLNGKREWEKVPVKRLGTQEAVWVEEVYTCDHQGIVQVTLINHTTGLKRSFNIRPGV
jgi:molecular chaperone DnaK (HSP70)